MATDRRTRHCCRVRVHAVLTVRQAATIALRRRWDDAGTPPPALHPAVYTSVVRAAHAEHGLGPDADPEHLATAEGWRIAWVPLPRGCGAHVGGLILLPWRQCREERALLIQHERAHAWLARRGLHHATEADAWRLTAEFTRAALEARGSRRDFPWAPAWFLDLAG
jgi:hypothetical protein